MRSCSYCLQISNENDDCNFFYKNITLKYGLSNRIIEQTNHWILVPTIGAFISGYVLAISRQHYNSIATTPVESYSELNLLKNRINAIFMEKYNKPCFFFEHGAVSDKVVGSCCVSHTHLHMLPFDVSLDEELKQKYGFQPIDVKSFEDVSKYVKDNSVKSYFLYGIDNSNMSLFDTTNKMYPSQFFRQLICNKLGRFDDFDWRKKDFVDNMVSTIDELKDFF